MGHKYACYQRKLKELVEDKDVMGVLLVGKGALADETTFEALNDVDLIIITASGEKNRRSAMVIEGIDFDMSYLPIPFVVASIASQDILWIEILANSKTVYSKGIDDLVATCKDIWKKGPAPLRPIDKEYWSFYLTASLEDIKNRLSDEALSKYLITEFLTSVMKVTFKLKGRFEPLKKKRWIGQIKNLDAKLGNQIEAILLMPSITDQFEAVEGVYSELTDALGGIVSTWSHEEFPER